MVRIQTLSVGRPRIIVHKHQSYSSAINKRPVEGAVSLTLSGLAGDRVADSVHHGGADQAVCCFASEHYTYFEARLGRTLKAPAFGENLTIEGLLETEAAIGDSYRIGSARVQISQPRQPCMKLAQLHDAPALRQWIIGSGYTGFYLRVLEAGTVEAGEVCQLLERPYPELTVAVCHQTFHDPGMDPDATRRLSELPELSGAWREKLKTKL